VSAFGEGGRRERRFKGAKNGKHARFGHRIGLT
jgi:hypothetical protein